MPTLYPIQDTFVRGEISPRLHARASLDLYRAALSRCENFLTLPHGGIRKRGGTYFCAEVKDSSKATRLIPFIFSADQAYALEFGDLYIRVHAYGARVGTVEVATPYLEADLFDLQFVQSADQMWITHKNHLPQVLTRTAHTTWTLAEFVFLDGPYDDINTSATTLTPAETGAVHPDMTSDTLPTGTAASSAGTAYLAFDRDNGTDLNFGTTTGNVSYDFAGTATKVCDAYWIRAVGGRGPAAWDFQGLDGTSWISLDSRTAEPGWSRGEVRFYEFQNATAYQSYRLDISVSEDDANIRIAEMGWHEDGDTQTPFDLTASSIVGINDGTGFQTSDVGRTIRLLGSDAVWRWARITSRSSATVVKVRLYGHALPNLSPIARWRLGTFVPGKYVQSGSLYEER
ncbi:MAG: hypothetical protein E5Y16_22135, partial [Mesorhizobium sp.]